MKKLIALTCAVFVVLAGLAIAASGGDGSKPAPAKIVKLVTGVPVSTLNAVGAGPIKPYKYFTIRKLTGKPSGTKPKVLAATLAWCPHCASTGWAMAIALSRFGTFKGLRVINTGTYYRKADKGPADEQNIEGIDFYGARLSSRLVAFRDIIVQTVNGKTFERPTEAQNQALNAVKTTGGYPIINIGGIYGVAGIPFNPALLHGLSAAQIAGDLANPSSKVATALDGLANVLTAAICKATHDDPASVCRSKGVTAAAKVL